MAVPEIKAKLILDTSSTGGAGAGGAGGFSKSENRSFRLEQTKAFRFARLAGGKNVGTLATIVKLLGPTGALAIATAAGTVGIIAALKKLLDKYGPEGPKIETPEEATKPWSQLTAKEKAKRLSGSASIEPIHGEIAEKGGLGGGTLAGSGPLADELERNENALADLNITTPLTNKQIGLLGDSSRDATGNIGTFEKGMKALNIEQNALTTAIISSKNQLSSAMSNFSISSGGRNGGVVMRKLTGPEKQSIQSAFMPQAGEETAGDVIRRLRAQTKAKGQSNSS